MANLGQIITRPDGSEHILTGSGWIPNTPQLEAAAASGAMGAALDSIVTSLSLGLIEAPGRAEREAVSPVGSKAGVALDIALLGTGLAGGARAIVKRGAREALEKAIPRAAAGAEDLAPLGGGLGKTPTGFIPRLSGRVPRVLQPSAAVAESGLQVIPGLRIIGDWVTVANQKNLAQVAGRTMRMSRADMKAGNGLLSPQTMEPVMGRFDDVYAATRDVITDKATFNQLAKPAQEALDANLITKRQFDAWTKTGGNKGDQMIDMRTHLRQVSRETQDTVRATEAREIIDDIQETIKKIADDTEFHAEILNTDIDYKVWKAVSQTGVIGKEGLINPTSLKRALGNSFGKNAVVGGARKKLPGRVQDLLQALDELEAIGYSVPTSGTAERAVAGSFIASMLGISIAN